MLLVHKNLQVGFKVSLVSQINMRTTIKEGLGIGLDMDYKSDYQQPKCRDFLSL